MPIGTQVRNRLWTPQGEHAIEKDVEIIDNPMERVAFIRMHEVAHRLGLALICKRCDTAIQGRNNGEEAIPTVACQCREFRFVR